VRLAEVADLPPTLTTAEAADLLGVSVDHLWALARAGEAPVAPLRLGRSYRWPTARLLDLLGLAGLGPGRGPAPGHGGGSGRRADTNPDQAQEGCGDG
jgi:excisionase family DNA binding protein